ncbi:unnamed protein product, partial [Mycena citricolor]
PFDTRACVRSLPQCRAGEDDGVHGDIRVLRAEENTAQRAPRLPLDCLRNGHRAQHWPIPVACILPVMPYLRFLFPDCGYARSDLRAGPRVHSWGAIVWDLCHYRSLAGEWFACVCSVLVF